MSTVVYQDLQSRLEFQLLESRTLKLKLFSPKTVFSQSLQTLPSMTSKTPCQKLQAPYVHPSAKHTSWWLSEKSLKLCTENLGSETGSEFIENSIFSSPACSSSTTENNKILVKREEKQQLRKWQVREPQKQFPPPLTTLSGPECLDIRPHPEDGRLILKATRTTTARRSCFQVDRSNGRLRLSLANDSSLNMCSSKEAEDDKLTSDQIVTNQENKYKNEKLEKNNIPERAPYFSYEEAEHVEIKKLLDQQRRGAACFRRCNESLENNKSKNTKKEGLMKLTLMVKLEPHFLVSSS